MDDKVLKNKRCEVLELNRKVNLTHSSAKQTMTGNFFQLTFCMSLN